MSGYLFDYDDPYKILAHHIVGFYRPADVYRIMSDNQYVYTLVQKETRNLDIGGNFLDCIIEGILLDKDRMEYMHELDILAKYMFSKLDKERLREEIKKILSEMGISYSSGGNVSSANT